jgi:hypothetical protein
MSRRAILKVDDSLKAIEWALTVIFTQQLTL